MTRRLLTALAVLAATSIAVPGIGHAQTFKMEKFDIKGDGGTDYVAVESATNRVFVSRATHMMVIDGATGKVVGDIPNTPGVHGAGIATKAGHGFTTNGGDSTVTMFDLKTLAVIKQIKVETGGLDGIMYDEPDDLIILTNHSRPIGTLVAINPKTGDLVGKAELEDTAPEGAAADGKGHIFVNNESKNTIQVIDTKTWKATASWPLDPCKGPTGIAYDAKTNRIFSGCNGTSVVVDANTGKVVATIKNGTRVDALGYDASKKLIYIPNGGEGNVTVVHQDSADKYTVVDTVATFAGAKTITVDPKKHTAYLFQPERGPAPAPAAAAGAPPAGRGRGPQGPIIAGWFIVVKQ
jgi:DNA-binding beta-propeller fold protein YncE